MTMTRARGACCSVNACLSTLPTFVKYRVIHKTEDTISESDQNYRSIRVLHHDRFFFFGPRVEVPAPRPLPTPRPLVPLPRPRVGFGEASGDILTTRKRKSGKMQYTYLAAMAPASQRPLRPRSPSPHLYP
jgi:hypothetical protein